MKMKEYKAFKMCSLTYCKNLEYYKEKIVFMAVEEWITDIIYKMKMNFFIHRLIGKFMRPMTIMSIFNLNQKIRIHI